ncbi:MAG: ABC transporter transmembrane domain-containing protein [Aliidongia sp.]
MTRSERIRPTGDGHRPAAAPFRDQARVVFRLMPLLWPRGEAALKLRVVVALSLIVAAKLINIGVPLLYKRAVDALSGHPVVIVPAALIIAYGLARVGAQAAGELRELVFARVAQRAIRLIALDVFKHLHALSLRFIWNARPAACRAQSNAARPVSNICSVSCCSTSCRPCSKSAWFSAVLWRFYSAGFAVTTLATIILYIAFTISVTQWRVRFRREMNERDGDANYQGDRQSVELRDGQILRQRGA